MKKTLILFLTILTITSCTLDNMMLPSLASDFEIEQSQTNPPLTQNVLYDEWGNIIPDFIPAVQPQINEACNTAWDNLSGIINPDGTITYFINLPDYTPDTTDYDKDRFTFIYQAQNPWFGSQWDDGTEEPYAQIGGAGWYMLPVDDYGSMTCSGLQEIRIWVLDELTGRWYMNSQVCYAAILCNGQGDCDQGWTFDQIEYTPYESGYIYLQPGIINNN